MNAYRQHTRSYTTNLPRLFISPYKILLRAAVRWLCFELTQSPYQIPKWHLAVSSQLRILPINMSAFLSQTDIGQNWKWLLLGKICSDVEKSKSFWNTSTREAGSQTLHYSNPQSFLENMILNFPSSPGFNSFKYLDEPLILQSEMRPHLLSAFLWISIIFILL